MRKLIWLAWLLTALPSFSQTGAVTGWCNQGATTAALSGMQSTNKLQGIVPSCTITVYLTGTTTPATIFANSTGTALGNPFTASTKGQWLFYASGLAGYDVVASGGACPACYSAPVTLTTDAAPSPIGSFLPLSGGTLYGALAGPNINGELYPAICESGGTIPSWCAGSTPDAWYRAACTQLKATGGIINQLGLTGTIAASMTCSTPTKQVITVLDPTSILTITQSDGGVVYPLSNGSMVLGPGGGQCDIGGGIHLASTANVSAVFANAQTDGSQEHFTVEGTCFWGSTNGVAGTVTKGVIYAKKVFVNTTISSNFIAVCPAACLLVENTGGILTIAGNEFNGTSGILTFNTSPLKILADGGQGCLNGQIDIFSTNAEHANGGAAYPEVNITGDDAGAKNCAVYINGMYTERNQAGTPSTIGIKIRDCQSCSVTNVQGGGSSGGDLVNISQSADQRNQDIILENISNVFGSYANTVNDTTTNGTVLSFDSVPFVTTYYSSPGFVMPPVLPSSTVQSLGTDAMNGDGAFSTGSGTLPTNFGMSGCLVGQGMTCNYARTNSAPPPNNTYSEQIQITGNTDTGIGNNGVEYTPLTSFTAGQPYAATFWGKGDGTFVGTPIFFLWDPTIPVTFCRNASSTTFTSTWTLYSFVCIPATSGSSHLSINAATPPGGTGTFWLGGFTFNPIIPMAAGNLLTSLSPYGIGPATTPQQQFSINGVTCQLTQSCTIPIGLTGTTGTITGTALTATCDSGTATVTGAVVGHPVTVSSTTGADVGGAFNLRASVTATNTVTVYICGTGTPASLAYRVTVF